MSSEAAKALDEVIRQFGRQLVARPDRLRAALADILLADDEGPGVDALVAVSSAGVASGLEGLEGPVTEAQVAEWFEALATAGLSRSDAASATAVWAEVLGPAERAREVSEISRTLSTPPEEDAPAKPGSSAGSPETESMGGAGVTVVGVPGGDATIVGGTLGASDHTDAVSVQEEAVPVLPATRGRRWAWVGAAGAGVLALAVVGIVIAGVLASRGAPDATASTPPATASTPPAVTAAAMEQRLADLLPPDNVMDGAASTSAGGVWAVASDNQGVMNSTVTGDDINTWIRIEPTQCAAVRMIVPAGPTAGVTPWSWIKVFHENGTDGGWIASVFASVMLYDSDADMREAIGRMRTNDACEEVEGASMTLTWGTPRTTENLYVFDVGDDTQASSEIRAPGQDAILLARRCWADPISPILQCWSFVHLSGADIDTVYEWADQWFQEYVLE